jgi:hypothetical protein
MIGLLPNLPYMATMVQDNFYHNIMDNLSKIYSDYQGNDTEKLIVVTDDRDTIVFERGGKNRVSVPLREILIELAHRGKSLRNVVAMIHNHNRGYEKSPEDSITYRKLWNIGFRGSYQIYDPQKRRLKPVQLIGAK